MKKLLMISVLAVSMPLASVTAKDLLVDPKKPGAYATLQAAMNAASPGDRILVKGPLQGIEADVVIDKSVTIESVDHTKQDLVLYWGGGSSSAQKILIKNLTMGLPLTLRRLNIELVPYSGASSNDIGIRSDPSLFGEVRMEDVDVRWTDMQSGSPYTNNPGKMVDLTMDGWVWLRRCNFIALDHRPDYAAATARRYGTDALIVRAMSLVMEDCKVRGGSAGFGKFATSMQFPFGGDGGFALKANTFWTLLVRSSFSDGNGSLLEAGAWQTTPKPGKAKLSQFTGPHGYLGAYDSTHERGRDGAVVKSYTPTRGSSAQLGDPEAPLTVAGSAVLGKSIDIEIARSSKTPVALVFGCEWWLSKFGSIGDLWLNPRKPLITLPVNGPGKMSFGVPNNIYLIDLPFLGQVITNSTAGFKLGNPSGIAIRK